LTTQYLVMDALLEAYNRKLSFVSGRFERYMLKNMSWKSRLIAIKGARGVGKTTLMLQNIKKNLNPEQAIYMSLDNIYFSQHGLYETVSTLEKRGVVHFYIDEVHKYPSWAREIKNLYDDFPAIKLVISGSSILELQKGDADLSRRMISYTLKPMSFREYLEISEIYTSESFSLEELLASHVKITKEILAEIKPLRHFSEYLRFGSYPYSLEGHETYHEKLRNTINVIIDSDLPSILNIDYAHSLKLKKLLAFIGSNTPYKPNIQKLAEQIQIDRRTVYQYLDILNSSELISLLETDKKGDTRLSKPEKIYMSTTSLAYALNAQADIGTIRETFFYSQMKDLHHVNYSKVGDFLVNNNYIFEVGGKSKSFEQIKDLDNSFVVKDDIETGHFNTIPLWLFGFMY
jgi:predicted AAA+ superfamily ATPase